MFIKKCGVFRQRRAVFVSGLGECDLRDTFECGQAFRYEQIADEKDYVEYFATAYGIIIRVGQQKRGELIFFGDISDGDFEIIEKYFSLDTDFEKIRQDVISHTDSAWLKSAADCARGITILKQDPWEALLSFIISQNNNIPRIRKIIRAISLAYGENLAKAGGICPKTGEPISDEVCAGCGACYSFPTAKAILNEPELLLPSHPGFRYKYMLDAADKVSSGVIDLDDIDSKGCYAYTLEQLKRIVGVGDKVASCVALFGFANLDAFPIDVWMKRAIDEYFDGELDPVSLGKYAGVAQQYIFHYIRNLSKE